MLADAREDARPEVLTSILDGLSEMPAHVRHRWTKSPATCTKGQIDDALEYDEDYYPGVETTYISEAVAEARDMAALRLRREAVATNRNRDWLAWSDPSSKLTNFDTVLKEYYSDDKLKALAYSNNFLSTIKKEPAQSKYAANFDSVFGDKLPVDRTTSDSDAIECRIRTWVQPTMPGHNGVFNIPGDDE